MKFLTAVLIVILAAFASAESKAMDIDLEEESPRFGFIDLTNNGATLTLNSTTLQYAVVTGIVLILVALVVIPLLGFSVGSFFTARNEYDNPQYTYDGNQAYSSYSAYAQRSLDVLSPILKALRDAYLKYE